MLAVKRWRRATSISWIAWLDSIKLSGQTHLAKTESIQPEPVRHNAKALTAIPINELVLFLNLATKAPDLAETASHRLNVVLFPKF